MEEGEQWEAAAGGGEGLGGGASFERRVAAGKGRQWAWEMSRGFPGGMADGLDGRNSREGGNHSRLQISSLNHPVGLPEAGRWPGGAGWAVWQDPVRTL